jgi:MFS family permease
MSHGVSNKHPVSYVSLVSITAAVAGLLFGFDTGIISGALIFISKTFPMSTAVQEAIVGSVLFGAMFGSLFSGTLTDGIGRKRTMLVIASFFIVGTLIATFATSIIAILLGRSIIGVAIGIGSYTAPLYIAEVAPVNIRGKLVTLNQLAITLGIFFSYIINYIFIQSEGSF